jgi:hypothetical protein
MGKTAFEEITEQRQELGKLRAKVKEQSKLLEQALGALKSLFSFEVDHERGARCSAAITALEQHKEKP